MPAGQFKHSNSHGRDAANGLRQDLTGSACLKIEGIGFKEGVLRKQG